MAGIVVVKQDYAGCSVFSNVMNKEVLRSKSDDRKYVYLRDMKNAL